MRLRSFLAALSASACLTVQVFAYEPGTHREVAERAALPARSSLDSVLRTELGIAQGVDVRLLGQTPTELIGLGAAGEDDPDLRSLNHFHNPLIDPWDDAGLSVGFGLLARGTSSVLWQQRLEQDSASVRVLVPLRVGGGNWSWQDARRRYLDALTGSDRGDRLNSRPGGREKTLAEVFLGLGHLMHVVQDATVPAHVRNDPHPDFLPFQEDGYEKWVDRVRTQDDRRAEFDALLNLPPVRPSAGIFMPTGNGRAPVPIARLIDTDRFGGLNFGVLTDIDLGVAEYTNGNFLSRHTIFRDFALPRRSSLEPTAFAEPEGARFRTYFSKVTEGEAVGHFVAVGGLHRSLRDALQVDVSAVPAGGWVLEDRVHADYATQLIPRAVGYSAALLDYFFRGKLDVDLFSDDGSTLQVRGTNASPDALVDGTLTLYADVPTVDPAGRPTTVRRELTALGETTVRGVDPRQALSSALFQPQEAERFVAVYLGRLGDEIPVPNPDTPTLSFPGGVIGKVLGGVRVEEVFSDGSRWKLRTPTGVFLLNADDRLLTTAEFEEIRWGDADNLLVARTPFGLGRPNRFVAYEVPRRPGSVEPMTVETPDGLAVPLAVRNEAVFPAQGIDLGTTVNFHINLQFRRRIAKFEDTVVFVERMIDNTNQCVPDHTELGPLTIKTVQDLEIPFSGSFPVILDLAHELQAGTTTEPYFWQLRETGATVDARFLGLVRVNLTEPEGEGVSVPVIRLNRDTGEEEVVGQSGIGPPSFPNETNDLWALVDLKTGEVVASTATSNLAVTVQETVGRDIPDVYSHSTGAGCTTFDNGWFPRSLSSPHPEDPVEGTTNVSAQQGILNLSVTGQFKDELRTLAVNGRRLFPDPQIGTDSSEGELLYGCAVSFVTGARSCRTLSVSITHSGPLTRAVVADDARRSRPAPGAERLVFANSSEDEFDLNNVIVWDPTKKTARVLMLDPSTPFQDFDDGFVVGPVTGVAALVIPKPVAFTREFLFVPLEGADAPGFISNDNGDAFTLLNPRFLYNVGDLKFYRPQSQPQRTVLPAKLVDVPGSPIGDYHAIRLP